MHRPAREEVFAALECTEHDLLVVGAGVVGARIAFDAARLGLTVALVDAGDFGGGTSSASSKLVHGGLRYLATGQLGLVRHAQRERQALEVRVAPGLVWPQSLMLVATPEGLPAGLLPVVLATYRSLAGRPDGRRLTRLDPELARALVPALRPSGVAGAIVIDEAQTNDARLTLALVRAATDRGALVANYLDVVGLETTAGRVSGAAVEDIAGSARFTVRARAVVNATGPWVDGLRHHEEPGARPLVRLSRGTNLTLALDEPWQAAVAVFDRSRSVLAAPWLGLLLLGATDAPFDGDPACVEPTNDEVEELLGGFDGILADHMLDRSRVRAVFSGIRALAPGTRSTTMASRDHVVGIGRGGMVSVAGGKLTTHRLIALSALQALPPEVRPRGLKLSDVAITPPVRSSDIASFGRAGGVELGSYLTALYGGRIGELGVTAPDLEPIAPGGPDVVGQAIYARECEWAITVDDVVRRRTTLALRGLADDATRARLAVELGLPDALPRAGARAVA